MKVISNALLKLSYFSRKVALKLLENDEWTKTLARWKEDNLDKNLRLNYEDLDSNAIVFDLGGYKGQWASDIFSKYQCRVNIFEPYLPFFRSIEKRFEKNNNISVHSFGLGKEDKLVDITVDKDSTSLFKKGKERAKIEIKKAEDFIHKSKYENIDLMKINIEGGEYDFLDHIIEKGIVSKVVNLQIQFHHFIPNARNRMLAIQDELRKTHELTYQYEFLWENWQLQKQ